jgi:cysteine desulfurase family protein (TIGR01976 family)
MRFPVEDLRRQFRSLAAADGFIFFDNAAGAQVPGRVQDAVAEHLLRRNVQRGAPYRQSREVDAMLERARESVAAFVNARNPAEIAFGLNATSFIRAISLAIGTTLQQSRDGARDFHLHQGYGGQVSRATGARTEIIVSELDHEANIATWLALERLGAQIVWWRVRDDGRLDVSDLEPLLSERTRVVACTMAANATGAVVDVASAARLAHAAGAELFLDAVHYAPHGPIDVQQIGCDYLVCSGYKIFAPHMGFIWCRQEAINALPTFREDFIPDVTPAKLEAGTYGYESVAGMNAAVAYLEEIGRTCSSTGQESRSRGETIRAGMSAIREYERSLSREWLTQMAEVDGVVVHGMTDASAVSDRVPTLSFTVRGVASSAIADALAARGVGVRSGHMYSPRVIARLGLMPEGVVRASLVHYNTSDEIARFRDALVDAIRSARLPPPARLRWTS